MAGDLDRRVVLGLELEVSNALAGMEQFNNGAAKMAASGQKVAASFAPINPEIAKVTGQLLQLGVKFQSTGAISQRSLATIGVGLNELAREFGKTTSSADKLGAAERQAFTVAQAAHKDAIARLREYNEELTKVQVATRSFHSVESFLQVLPGLVGKVAGPLFLMYEAAKLGWEWGEKLGKQLEKLPNFKKSWDDLAESVFGYSQRVKEAAEFSSDPRFAGTRTATLLADIIAKQAEARRAFEAGATPGVLAEDEIGAQLKKSFYENNLRLRKEAQAAELQATKEHVARMLALDKALHGGGGLANVFQMQTKPFGQPSLDLLKQVSEQEQRDHEANARFDAAAATKRAEEWKRVNDEIIKNWESALDGFASDMADVFTAGVIGGAEGFASAASKLFLQSVNDGAKGIFKQLGKLAFGAPPSRGDFTAGPGGEEQYNRALKESTAQSQALMGAFTGAVGVLGETLSMLQNAKKGQETSVLGATLSFAAAGASIGSLFTPLGAAIGAVVGAIAGMTIALIANAKALKTMPYALYGIRDGQPYVEPAEGKRAKNFANVTAAMYNDMISQMTHTMENTQNEYIKLLLKFPNAVADSITAANFAPLMKQYQAGGVNFMKLFWGAFTGAIPYLVVHGFGTPRKTVETPGSGTIGDPNAPGQFGKNALKSFTVDFQNWVNNTLPKEIIAGFEAPLMEGFATLGLAAEKFHQIWDRLQAIDPKDAIKSLNDLYDALTAFQAIQADRGKHIYGGAGFEFTGGWLDDASVKKSFADQLAGADAALVQMGATIEELIGPEQITQAKAWGDALLQRQQALKQFFQQVAQAIDNVIRGYQSSIRDLTLQGMTKDGKPDVGAQVNYLKKYADQLYQQIQTAPTMDAATALSAELQRVILQIQQLGGAQGVEAAESFRLWAIEQLKNAQNLVVTRLQALAQSVADQNAAFLDAVKEFIEAFRNATDAINGDTTENTTNGNTSSGSRATGRPDYWGPRHNAPGGDLLSYPTGMSISARSSDLRELIEVNREVLRVMREGRDVRVSGGLDVTINDQPASSVPLSGGFERRTLNGRYRAS